VNDGPCAPAPAYRLVTPDLELRAYDPSQAAALRRAITESLDHLRPWMPWAESEPQPLDQKVELLRKFRAHFDLGIEFGYAMFDRRSDELVGGTGLHPRAGPGALEIGYWVHVRYVGRGLATQAAAALTRAAIELHRVRRVEIRCDPANVKSAAIPRKLGYKLEATLRAVTPSPRGLRDAMVWTMLDDELAGSEAAGIELEGFDAIGRRLL
jgi:RimJ/RimL family protein N-acetyltransferase